MYKNGDKLLYSPTDLVCYIESPLLSWFRRHEAEFPGKIPKNAKDEMVAKMGYEHEKKYLESLKETDGGVVEIDHDDSPQEKTLEALKNGSPVVYQAALRMEDFHGSADFLIKVGKPSNLGAYSYEPVDTKLSLKPKPYFLVQLCCYAEMLESICGSMPESVHVVLGDRTVKKYKTLDYFYYYRQVKEAFLEQMRSFDPNLPPEPAGNESFGEWQDYVAEWIERQDHLIQVANIRISQIKNLKKKNIATMKALSETGLTRIPNMDSYVFAKLKKQAALQIASKPLERPLFEILPPKDDKMSRQGLASLPPPSKQDVFFDMEGYPFVSEGLEYLFGAMHAENGEGKYVDFWAHDRAAEKKAFEDFIDWAHDRFIKDVSMHIYHYANYEVSAVRRLSQRHATREEVVDHMLRCGVFVDLYQIVRHCLIVGEPGYSIKNIESIYMGKRQGGVRTAGDSVVYYERWLEGRDGDTWRDSKLLKDIRDYNESDCRSTMLLVDWLRCLQKERKIEFRAAVREAEKTEEGPALTPEEARSQEMLNNIPEDIRSDSEKERVWRLLAHILVFHKRADKPEWWEFFDRHDKTNEELSEDMECLSDLKLIDIAERGKALYKFDPSQDTKITEGTRCRIAGWVDSRATVTVEEIDTDKGRIVLSFGGATELIPDRLSLIPDPFINKKPITDSISTTVSEYCTTRKLRPALEDFLYRRRPNLTDKIKGPLVHQEDNVTEGLKKLAANLNRTTLCIQGPPGTGKSHISASMILHLLKRKKRIGVTSNSHKAILNLMKHVGDRAIEEGLDFLGLKIGKKAFGDILGYPFFHVGENRDFDRNKAFYQLVGGTAWFFSRQEAADCFDYLFVDEAGQVSIANLVAMSRAAQNIVLVGDQMQLAQPVKGVHPEESGLSCLEYYLQDRHTIPPEQGVFLSETWRLHPGICSVISDAVYDGRLHTHPATRNRLLEPAQGSRYVTRGSGILHVAVAHDDNTQGSDEEVDVIKEIIRELLNAGFKDKNGNKRALVLDDILIVSPYNMQVIKLEKALEEGARVGTVDKFQGQEAPVVIVSMAASSGRLSTRGTEFLFNKNRLNVAVTRAQCLAIIVGSPGLRRTLCTNIPDMERVNMFCRLVGEKE